MCYSCLAFCGDTVLSVHGLKLNHSAAAGSLTGSWVEFNASHWPQKSEGEKEGQNTEMCLV